MFNRMSVFCVAFLGSNEWTTIGKFGVGDWGEVAWKSGKIHIRNTIGDRRESMKSNVECADRDGERERTGPP